MVRIDLVCRSCKHPYEVRADSTLKDERMDCPECGSGSVRQTFKSYMRNGPLLDPDLVSQQNCRPFG